MSAMTAQQIYDTVREITAAGANSIVSVMLDGRPDSTEDMVLRAVYVNLVDGEYVAECDVTDLELQKWTVDLAHVVTVRRTTSTK